MSKDAGFILLAAGLSSRFGSNKLLAPIGGKQPLILHTIKNILEASNKLLVVSKDSDAAVNNLLDQENIPHASTPLSALGMGHSLAFGVQQRPSWPGWIICLADMPAIKTTTYLSVQQALHHHQLVVPSHNGTWGKPVGFSAYYYRQLTLLQGDEGGKSILHNNKAHIHDIHCNDPGILLDTNTPEQLEKLKLHS